MVRHRRAVGRDHARRIDAALARDRLFQRGVAVAVVAIDLDRRNGGPLRGRERTNSPWREGIARTGPMFTPEHVFRILVSLGGFRRLHHHNTATPLTISAQPP